MPSAPNVFDIARQAGVSKSTAARALCGHGAVSDLARSKVLAAAEQLKYRANTVARNLRSGENRLLGVVLPASGSAGFLSHTVNAQKLEGLAQGARRLGYDLQIFIEDMDDRDALLRLATDRFVRGMFFLSNVALPVLAHLDEYQTPWIGVNWRHRQLPGSSYVWTDFAHAGATLAGHLFDQGCRQVLAFDWLSAEYGPYEEGLTQAVFDRNLPYAVLEIKSGRAYYEGPGTVQALRAAFTSGQTPPDGLVVGSAAAAIATYQYIRAEQPQCVIGRDLKMVCFDDFDRTAALEPGLTAYAQNFAGMGEAAIERMVASLEGRRTQGELCVEGSLRIRASSVGAASAITDF